MIGFIHKRINLIAKLTMLGTNILKFEKFDHDFLFAFYNGQHFDPPPPNGQSPLSQGVVALWPPPKGNMRLYTYVINWVQRKVNLKFKKIIILLLYYYYIYIYIYQVYFK